MRIEKRSRHGDSPKLGSVLQVTPLGGARGITLSSLARLGDVAGARPHRSLLTYLVRVLEAHSEDTLLFLHDMSLLHKASR